MIGILDYGGGNLGSVVNACAFLGFPARLVTEPEGIDGCCALILPGQGMFGECMNRLTNHGFAEPVRAWVDESRPFLGICVGLQILFEGSEESPDVPGLGLLPGWVRRFRLGADYKVPQMGWNSVRQVRADCPLFQDIPDGSYFYFVHSYYVDPAEAGLTAGSTDYGGAYTSVAWRDLLFAAQFHPEKSQRVGLQLLRNFARLAGLVPEPTATQGP